MELVDRAVLEIELRRYLADKVHKISNNFNACNTTPIPEQVSDIIAIMERFLENQPEVEDEQT